MESILQVGCSTYVAVVQLEERFPAKEEVIGSNPIGYTINIRQLVTLFWHMTIATRNAVHAFLRSVGLNPIGYTIYFCTESLQFINFLYNPSRATIAQLVERRSCKP